MGSIMQLIAREGNPLLVTRTIISHFLLPPSLPPSLLLQRKLVSYSEKGDVESTMQLIAREAGGGPGGDPVRFDVVNVCTCLHRYVPFLPPSLPLSLPPWARVCVCVLCVCVCVCVRERERERNVSSPFLFLILLFLPPSLPPLPSPQSLPLP